MRKFFKNLLKPQKDNNESQIEEDFKYLPSKDDLVEEKFTKNFISKVKKYGLNPDDISKNLNNFNVNWKKSNPFTNLNPKNLGTINISNLQYEISLESGNNKLRFKDIIEN